MDFSDTLYIAPAAPRTDAPAPANAAPVAGETSEFAAKLAETNSNDAKPEAKPSGAKPEASDAKAAPKSETDTTGAANTAAQASAAVQPAQPSQPIKSNAALLLALNTVQPEDGANTDTFNPTFPVAIDPATALPNAHSGSTPAPQAGTLPIPGAKKSEGDTIQNPTQLIDKQADPAAAPTPAAPIVQTALPAAATAAVVAATVTPTTPVTAQPTQLAAAAPVAAAVATPAAPAPAAPAATKPAPAADAKSAAPETSARTEPAAEPADKITTDAVPSTGATKTASAQPGAQSNGQAASVQSNGQPGAQPASQTVAQVNAQAAAVALDAATQAQAAPTAAAAPVVQIADASLATSATTSSSSSASATPAALQDAPAAVAQVYTRFIERNDGRAQRFEVRLDPAELGRVDVRIEVGADHKVHAVLAAHDSAALSDLMRGQRSLERALGDAGVDLADNGLSFELASDSRSGFAGKQGDAQTGADLANAWRGFDTAAVPVDVDANVMAAASRPWRTSHLDLVA